MRKNDPPAQEATVFLNARLLDPASGKDEPGGLLVKDGLIADLGTHLRRNAPERARVVDCRGHLLCPGRVTSQVEGVCEPAHQPFVVSRASRRTGDRFAEQLRRHLRRLTDQQVRGAGQPAQYPLVHRCSRATWPSSRAQQLPGYPVRRSAGLG